MKKIIFSFIFQFFFFSAFAAPQFFVQKRILDFGKFSANEKVSGEFTITNTGNSPLNISSIRSTCSCTELKFSEKVLPGMSTKIQLSIHKNSFHEAFSGTLYVISNTPSSPDWLRFKGEAIPLYTLMPASEIYLGCIVRNIPISKIFYLKTKDKITFGNPKFARGNLAEIKIHQQKAGIYDITVNLKQLQPQKGKRFVFEVSIPILRPSGWPSVKLLFHGRFK